MLAEEGAVMTQPAQNQSDAEDARELRDMAIALDARMDKLESRIDIVVDLVEKLVSDRQVVDVTD